MNLILFTREETRHPLPIADPRATHLLKILRRKTGEPFDAGIVNGPRLKGVILNRTTDFLELEFTDAGMPPPLHPVALLVGLPRPQTARKILQEVTSLGVAVIHFAATEKSEPSYAASRLWSTGEFHRHLIAGAEQAFTTRIPEVHRHASLAAALDLLAANRTAIALDNYEAVGSLRDFTPPTEKPLLLALGAERGWSNPERDLLRSRGIPLVRLGENVLRTETACLCALAILLAKLGLL